MKVSYRVSSDEGSQVILTAETTFEKHILTSIKDCKIEIDYKTSKHISYDEIDEVYFILT